MTHEEAEEVLRQITYKPGWEVVFLLDHTMQVCCTTFDVEGKAGSVTVASIKVFGPQQLAGMSPRGLLRHVYREVLRLEEHETKEWLKYQGKCVRPPHDGTPAHLQR